MPKAEYQQELDAHYNRTLPSTSTQVMDVHWSLMMIHLRLSSLQWHTHDLVPIQEFDCVRDLSYLTNYYFVLIQSDLRDLCGFTPTANSE